ncbi:vitamin B12 ABC transporter ATP-binding protein BtuD [Enterobacillus tribolii]|uniref:Vitamin B12 import ATP-binding protein BtuD n=1 Tax=Enterobacillus tribolii TaxID=1487935 RepID=A0A370R3L2_9GAMM|nr:vitamin B12 ABC transporter ATP-binding protein BtuD [Enterobacillus tribolii]MBW7984086.1 vitamin B12 ABC transporter ATP-binding protein BtuD [Enterobacillus tribolii]RDK97026.1 vitamin B12 transport system ATP-binding protein [Enterobacillus tribolii]
MTLPVLKVCGLSVGGRLTSFCAEVPAGQLIHVIGPNGAGKSTLLSCLAGIMAGEGEITLEGRPLTAFTAGALAQRRAYLPQQVMPGALMPVFQYLSLHQPPAALPEALDDAIGFLCHALMLEDKLRRPLSQLSGGEWQRVRIAAVCLQIWPALNARARLLLLDEPMASLDIAQQAAVDGLIEYLVGSGISVIASAHDINHTLHHARRVWMLKNGVLMAQGATENIMVPDNLSRLFNMSFTQVENGDKRWLLYG